jgi:sporulation protein YlmC with PRC-barrel domain
MKRKLQMIISASAASLLALSALGQDQSNSPTNGDAIASLRISRSTLPPAQISPLTASRILGMTIRNYQNEKLGKISEVAVDVESGRIVEVILSTSGFLGLDRTFVAVPPEIFHRVSDQNDLRVDATLTAIDGAPRFDSGRWNQSTDSNRVMETYSYFRVHPYFVPVNGEYRTTSVDGVFASSLPRNEDGSIDTAGTHTADGLQNDKVDRELKEPSDPFLTRYPDGTWTTNQIAGQSGATSGWSSMVYVQRLSRLMGKPVNNLQNEKLGQVENVIVDLPTGRIVAVIISSREFAGADNSLTAVSPTKLKYNAEDRTLQLNVSKAVLANSPHFALSEL